jgi:hypothetical protein
MYSCDQSRCARFSVRDSAHITEMIWVVQSSGDKLHLVDISGVEISGVDILGFLTTSVSHGQEKIRNPKCKALGSWPTGIDQGHMERNGPVKTHGVRSKPQMGPFAIVKVKAPK